MAYNWIQVIDCFEYQKGNFDFFFDQTFEILRRDMFQIFITFKYIIISINIFGFIPRDYFFSGLYRDPRFYFDPELPSLFTRLII